MHLNLICVPEEALDLHCCVWYIKENLDLLQSRKYLTLPAVLFVSCVCFIVLPALYYSTNSHTRLKRSLNFDLKYKYFFKNIPPGFLDRICKVCYLWSNFLEHRSQSVAANYNWKWAASPAQDCCSKSRDRQDPRVKCGRGASGDSRSVPTESVGSMGRG